jgi:hypothetical protein
MNYFFHDEPAKVLTNVHELFILEAPTHGITLVYLQNIISHHTFTTNQYGEGISSDKTSHVTITYFAKVVGVSPVFSEKLVHIVPTVHRSWWLLMALYKN